VIAVRAADDRALASPLGRTSPVAKLVLVGAWVAGLALTTDPRPPLVLGAIGLAGAVVLGRVRPASLVAGLAPLVFAALTVGFFNALLNPANANPAFAAVVSLGPIRLTAPAISAGVALSCRVGAVAALGIAFGLTTDTTRLVDALVQQAHVPERFAYGALAAFQAIPRLAEDLVALREARRIRGLRASWHPRILVGLLVLAIRRADRLAVAMDARGFGSGPRTRFRSVEWSPADGVLLGVGVAVLVAAMALGRGS
jgi:energy-coupling factor transport system permease protein